MINWKRLLTDLGFLVLYTLIGIVGGAIMGGTFACIIYVGREPHYFRWSAVIIPTVFFGLYTFFLGIRDLSRYYF